MNMITFSKALILISCLAASAYTVGSYSAATPARGLPLPKAQPVYPAERPADDTVQTVVVSAKRLTAAEKARIDAIESQLSTQNALIPKKPARILT
ncbi:MAG: hypothetical protein V4488_04210 [Pseudomonadota bacterium]